MKGDPGEALERLWDALGGRAEVQGRLGEVRGRRWRGWGNWGGCRERLWGKLVALLGQLEGSPCEMLWALGGKPWEACGSSGAAHPTGGRKTSPFIILKPRGGSRK